jgi:SAM-dependent methyltransferase
MLLDEVARSLDAPRVLLPHLPELFADLQALGTTPRRAVNWLASAGVGEGDVVVDLGCGKGASAIEAALRLGCEVVAIDGFGPFIESAREHAERRGVGALCTFEVGDCLKLVRGRGPAEAKQFDAGMMLSVAPLDEATEAMRTLVRPGGVYLIDDAVWVGRAESEDIPRASEARKFIEGAGDRVLKTHTFGPAELLRLEASMQKHIRKRVRMLGRREPSLKPHLSEFMARQRTAIRMLTTGPLRPVLWLVRRGKGKAGRRS